MTDASERGPQTTTIGGFDRAGVVWVLGMFGVGGGALGALLPVLAGWVTTLPWFPFQGPLELLASFDALWLVWGRPLLGVLLGLAFGGWIVLSTPVLHLTAEQIRVERRREVERVIRREQVDAVHRRGSKVVIETRDGRQLFNDDIEGDRSDVRAAFTRHGYPWEGAPG